MKTFKQYNLLIEGSDWLILKSLDASKKGSMVIDSRTGVIFHMANLATEYTFKSDEWNKIYDMLDDNDTNMVDEVTKDLNE
jgi:flagellar biosynthesis component FlhA